MSTIQRSFTTVVSFFVTLLLVATMAVAVQAPQAANAQEPPAPADPAPAAAEGTTRPAKCGGGVAFLRLRPTSGI